MVIHEDLDSLYRKLDYAQWQKEANKGSSQINYECSKLIKHYKKEIARLTKKKGMVKQLTLF